MKPFGTARPTGVANEATPESNVESVVRPGTAEGAPGQPTALDTLGTFTDALVFTNPAVFSGYLAELRKADESSPREYLRAEAQRWLSAHGAPGCVPGPG